MTQAESPGVQGLPIECCNRAAQGGRRPRRKPAAPAVARVSYQGMVQMGHVNPYLVGAPRLQPTLDMAVVGKVLQHPVMGMGSLPPRCRTAMRLGSRGLPPRAGVRVAPPHIVPPGPDRARH